VALVHIPLRRIESICIASGPPPNRRVAVYNHHMAKDVIHISEAEATNDFASLMARVREGAEVIIEKDARPVAIVRPAEPHVRLLSESLRLAKEHGSTATLDGEFGRDLEEIINSHREPLNPPAWD
jgi:prevent-host-death family protein